MQRTSGRIFLGGNAGLVTAYLGDPKTSGFYISGIEYSMIAERDIKAPNFWNITISKYGKVVGSSTSRMDAIGDKILMYFAEDSARQTVYITTYPEAEIANPAETANRAEPVPAKKGFFARLFK